MQTKRKKGEQFGCVDTSPPEKESNYSLSRIMDALDAAEEWGGQPAQTLTFQIFPEGSRIEYNYSKWSYEPPHYRN